MKTARTRIRPATLTALALAILSAPARGDETLRWKLTRGQKLTYRMVQKTENRPEAAGAPATSTVQTMEMTWTVKDVAPSGDAAVDQTIDRIVFEMKGNPGGDLRLDTDRPEKPEGLAAMFDPLLRGMVGSPIATTMTPRGEVKDVKIPARMLDAFKSVPGGGAGMFSEETLKSMFSQFAFTLPAQAIAKGHRWDATKHVDMPFGRMNLKESFTYEGPDGPVDRIALSIVTDLEPKEGQPFTLKITDQEGKGSFRFDNKAGALRGSDVTQTMKMSVKVGEQSIVMNTVSTVTMELIGPPSSK